MTRSLAAVVAGVLAGSVLLPAERAWACTCPARSTAQHFDAAHVVFTGLVTALETRGDRPAVASIAPSALYKGEVDPVTSVRTPSDGASCGIAFVPGARYTIFARQEPAGLHSDLCSGTQAGTTVLAEAGFVAVRLFTGPTPSKTQSAGPIAVVPADAGEADERAGPIAAASILLAAVVAAMLTRRRHAGRSGGSPGTTD